MTHLETLYTATAIASLLKATSLNQQTNHTHLKCSVTAILCATTMAAPFGQHALTTNMLDPSALSCRVTETWSFMGMTTNPYGPPKPVDMVQSLHSW